MLIELSPRITSFLSLQAGPGAGGRLRHALVWGSLLMDFLCYCMNRKTPNSKCVVAGVQVYELSSQIIGLKGLVSFLLPILKFGCMLLSLSRRYLCYFFSHIFV